MIPIQSSKFSILSNLRLFPIGVLFGWCIASIGEIIYLDNFVVVAALCMLYLSQNHA
jgi:hypothetical protein